MSDCNSSASVFIDEINPTMRTINWVYLAILSPIVVVLNATLIASFIATKQVWMNASNFLIMCISFTDFLSGSLMMPLLATYLHDVNIKYSCLYMSVTFVLMYLVVSVALLLTMLMALDRYIHMNPDIERPSRLRKIFKQPYLSCTVVIVCLLCVVFSWFSAFSAGKSGVTTTIIVGSGIILFLITVPCLYIRGYLRVRRFTRVNANANSTYQAAYLKSLSKTVMILISLACFSSLPFAVSNIVYVLVKVYGNKGGVKVAEICWQATGSLVYLNSTGNSLVIFMRNEKSKEWVKSVLCCKKRTSDCSKKQADLKMCRGCPLAVINKGADADRVSRCPETAM